MIRTIFVPSSGSTTDDSVFWTALSAAKLLDAHLDFYHMRTSSGDAAVRSVPMQFCPAAALGVAVSKIESREQALSVAAIQRFESFCDANDIPRMDRAAPGSGVSARRIEEVDRNQERLIFHARHHDLIVLGRPHAHDPIRNSLIDGMLMRSGRPVLIAPEKVARRPIETIVVCWNETAAAAHALAAAMPLIKAAVHVVIVGISDDDGRPDGLMDIADQLAWHGVRAVTRSVSRSTHPAATQLMDEAAELDADLLVAGGYGHMPWREFIAGGVTRSLIERAEISVLLTH